MTRKPFIPKAPNPHDPADRYCHYCDKQYANLGVFKRHVLTRHGTGLAKRLGLVPLDPGEVIEW
jgi:hypothetical protein